MKKNQSSEKTIDRLLEIKSEAILLFKNTQYVESLNLLEEAIKIAPSDLELLFYEALCLYHLGSIDRACLIIEQLYEMDTDEVLPSLSKACCVILLKNNKFNKAKSLIDHNLEDNPQDMQWLKMLGYAYEKIGKKSDAEKIYQRILTKDEMNAGACNALAYLYLHESDKRDEANRFIKIALKEDPENPAYLDTAGMLKIAEGEPELGLQILKKALSHSPGNQEILSHINKALKDIQ